MMSTDEIKQIAKSVGIATGDRITFQIPGTDLALLGTVQRIFLDQGELPIYEILKDDEKQTVYFLRPEFIE